MRLARPEEPPLLPAPLKEVPPQPRCHDNEILIGPVCFFFSFSFRSGAAAPVANPSPTFVYEETYTCPRALALRERTVRERRIFLARNRKSGIPSSEEIRLLPRASSCSSAPAAFSVFGVAKEQIRSGSSRPSEPRFLITR